MAIFSIAPFTTVVNNVAGAAFEDDTAAADTLNVGIGAYLIDDVDPAVFLANTGAWTVNISGSLFSTDGDGLKLDDGGSATTTIKISADGAVGSQQAAGIFAGGRVSINNAGFIGGSPHAIVLNNTGQNSIINTGTITSTGFAITDFGLGAGLILTNSGEILNSIILGNGIHNITNSGDIIGDVTLGTANDTVTNSGYIALSLELGDGDNKLTNKSDGWISNVSAGSGNDVVSNAGNIDVLNLGDGNNTFTNAVHCEIDFGVSAGSGIDVVSNAGDIDGLNLGDGNNKLTNAASGRIFDVSAGIGSDVVSNAGEIDGLDLGDGANKLTNKATIFGVSAGGGNDTVTNSGFMEDVSLGERRQ